MLNVCLGDGRVNGTTAVDVVVLLLHAVLALPLPTPLFAGIRSYGTHAFPSHHIFSIPWEIPRESVWIAEF